MHLSYSQINSYRLCPHYWYLEKIEGEFLGLTTVSMSRGRGVHKGAEANFTQKIDTHEDLPADDIIDRALAEYEASIAQDGYGLFFNPEEKAKGENKVIGEEMDRTVRLAGLFADKVAPEIQPDLVEEKGRIEVSQDLEVIGFIDVAQQGVIHDLKTSLRSKGKNEAHNSFQLTTYAILYSVTTGEWPTGLELDVLVDKKKPEVQNLRTTRDRGDMETWLEVVVSTYEAIQAGVFPPAPIGSWKCSPKWCPAWPTCKYVSRSAERRSAGAG